jgi:hypothetical protein
MNQLNFLDTETGLTPPVVTLEEVKASPVQKPSESQCATQRAEILQALEWAGENGVSLLRMLEIAPASYRQRISQVRAELQKRGLDVECEKIGAGSLYRLKPYQQK